MIARRWTPLLALAALAGCGETTLSLSFVSEELRADGGLCIVVAVIENDRARACRIEASWTAFDARGGEIATATTSGSVPANGRSSFEATFHAAGGSSIGCPSIDRFTRDATDADCP